MASFNIGKTNEIWKPIEGFGGKYEVSSLSRVRNTKTGNILKPIIWNTGYLIVRLFHEGKTYVKTLHRLVAVAFIPNPHNYPVVNHINENRADARIENLEWCTQAHNIKAHIINERKRKQIQYWEDLLNGKTRFDFTPEKQVIKKVNLNIGGKIRFRNI